MPVIPATQEVEARESQVRGQPQQLRPLSQNLKKRTGGVGQW